MSSRADRRMPLAGLQNGARETLSLIVSVGFVRIGAGCQ
jgi:hypothetical protein